MLDARRRFEDLPNDADPACSRAWPYGGDRKLFRSLHYGHYGHNCDLMETILVFVYSVIHTAEHSYLNIKLVS